MQAIFQAMKSNDALASARRTFAELRDGLSQLGHISQGSVQDRTHRQGGGAGYQWTRKVAQKTVSVALTPEQFQLMKAATANYQQLRKTLKRMETLSRVILFGTAPHTARLKRLSPKVLGTK